MNIYCILYLMIAPVSAEVLPPYTWERIYLRYIIETS
nr:MAG TPA: hypothetical protein [Caudoviricetes sp.]